MTGGVFSVTIWFRDSAPSTKDRPEVSTKEVLLWDRKRDGGFPGMFFKLIIGICFALLCLSVVMDSLLIHYVAAPSHSD